MAWYHDLFGIDASASVATRDGERMWTSSFGPMSISGEVVTEDTSSQHWAVRACVEALCGPLSTMPLMVFERGEGDTRKPARDHSLYRILHDSPNRRQTSQEYRDEQFRHLSLWRNFYAEIVPAADGSPVGQLVPIHPSRMREIKRDDTGRVYYRYTALNPGAPEIVRSEDEIHHIRKAPLRADGLAGIPVWESDRETIGNAIAVDKFGSLYFRNGGTGGGVLKHPGSFKSKEDQAAFLEAWRQGGSGINRHRDRLLLHGVDYTPFTIQNDEAQFLETKKQAGYEVASIWNMPPHRVGMLERATNNNIEQQSIEFVVYTLAPWISGSEQAIRRDLLIGEDQERYFVEYNVAGLLRGDLKARYEAYMQGRNGGWLSINDIRRLENMNPIDDGDDYLQPLNMIPAGSTPPVKEPAA